MHRPVSVSNGAVTAADGLAITNVMNAPAPPSSKAVLPRARTLGASGSKPLARAPPSTSAAAVEYLHQVVVAHERPSSRKAPVVRER